MKRLRFRGFIKTAVLALALNGAVQAAPLILATVQGTTCAVTVTLDALTFSYYGTTLTYTFVAGANQISFQPPNPSSGSPTNPLSFPVPAGTYTLWITVGPYAGYTASSAGYQVTVAPCPLSNTGVRDVCTTLPVGTVDPHWQLATPYPSASSGTPIDPTNPPLTFGPVYANTHDTAWIPNGPFSGWVTPSATALHAESGGQYVYRTTFERLSAAPISGHYSSDNELLGVYLNGLLVPSFPLNGPADFNTWTYFTIASGILVGPNTLDFVVRNRGVGGVDTSPTVTGLRVEFAGLDTSGCLTCAVPPAGLVAWWPLDETTGSASAELANGLNGSWTGTPAPTAGMVGGGLQFPFNQSVPPEVVVPHNPKLNLGTGDFTIDAWINPTGPGTIVSKFASNKGYQLYLGLVVGGGSGPLPVGVTLNNNGFSFSGTCHVTQAIWTHIAVTAKSGLFTCYLNGAVKDTKTFTYADLTNTAPFEIGYGVAGLNSFPGIIDEVELFNRALTDPEVRSISNAGSAGKCKSAVNLPWDKPFCAGQQSVLGVAVGVCNYSTTPKTYSLSLTGLPAGTPGLPSGCTIDGPSLFDKSSPITAIPPPVQVTVPANTCTSVPTRIHRPTNMTALNQIGCYRADIQDSATGAIVSAFGSVQDRRDVCPVVTFGGGNVVSTLPVNLGELANISFQLENTSGGLLPLSYQIATMPSDLSLGRNVVSLNGLDPGVPVSGSIVLQSGQQSVSLPVQVTYRNSDPFGYQDVILSTDNGNGQFVPLGSQNFRLIRPNETIPVSAATFARGTPLAAGSIVSAFGAGLSGGTAAATFTPLPTSLAGTSVTITDTTGQQLAAPLFFVSPGQINLQIPGAVQDGPASFSVLSGGKSVSGGSLTVGTPTAGLFTANASGAGVVAAFYLRVRPDGSRVQDYVFNPQTLTATPLDVSAAAGQLYLLLFGTGITGGSGPVTATVGGQDVPVLAAVPQGQFVGLDQVNIGPLPASLSGRGEVPVVISAGGADSSSAATVTFGGASSVVNVSFVTAPVPLSITINGQTVVGNSGVLTFTAGQTIPIDVPIDPQTLADPNTRYRFYGWSQGGPKKQNLVIPYSSTAFAAYFLTEQKLTIVGNATVSPSSADGFYSENVNGIGQTVTVNGTCQAGQTVSGYNIQGTGSSSFTFSAGASVAILMSAPKTVTVVCVAVQTSCVTPPQGMIAWYPLDEAQSPSLDIAPGGAKVNANWIGNPASIGGMVGKALSFGANQYVEAAGAAEGDIATGDFSIDAWVQASPSTGVTTFIDKRDLATGVRGYSFYLFNGNLGFQLADNSTISANCSSSPASSGCTNWGTSALVADGKWHLVAATVSRGSNTGGKLFVDGAQVLTFDPTIRSLSLSNSARLRIGGGFGSDFFGNVDEAEIFNRALLPSEVQLLYSAGSFGKCKPSLQTVTLTVQTSPVGLQARIGAIGAYAPAPISQLVQANQTQTISVTDPQFNTATGTGYSFTGWSTGGSTATTTVQPASNFTATATFKVACYALTVGVLPAGGGTVSVSPQAGGLAGLPQNCYAPGTVVTLTATGANGNVIQSWTGATGTGNTATVTVNGATTVTANFAQAPVLTIFLQSRASGTANLAMGVTNSGGTTATNVTVTAITATGATFVYNPGLLTTPFVIPGAAALNPGATSGFNLNFTATSGNAAAPFSFVITVKADNVPAFSTTINVP